MSTQTNQLYISPKILTWRPTIGGYEPLPDDWYRAYEHWEHAAHILSTITGDFQRVDAVASLQRSVRHRVSLLKRIYLLDQIPVEGKPGKSFSQLAYFGIIRPAMLKKLSDLRNAIEHEDDLPPNHERCSELLDFVWYFLRSTDNIAAMQPELLSLTTREMGRGFYVELGMGPRIGWKATVFSALLPPSSWSMQKVNTWIHLEVDPGKELSLALPEDGSARFSSASVLVCSPEQMKELVAAYFACLSFPPNH